MSTHLLLNVVLKHKSFMQICPKFCKLFYIETDQYHHISGSLVHLIVLIVDYLCQEQAKLGPHQIKKKLSWIRRITLFPKKAILWILWSKSLLVNYRSVLLWDSWQNWEFVLRLERWSAWKTQFDAVTRTFRKFSNTDYNQTFELDQKQNRQKSRFFFV